MLHKTYQQNSANIGWIYFFFIASHLLRFAHEFQNNNNIAAK